MAAPRKAAASQVFREALVFANKTHPEDVRWIESRSIPVSSFKDFFEEYVYVVCASGFKAKTASKLTEELVPCNGDLEKMQKIFGNKVKTESIAKVYAKYHDDKGALKELIDRAVKDHMVLAELPYIGPITANHLARNLGVIRTAKPDLHMIRFAKRYGFGDKPEDVHKMISYLAGEEKMDVGTADFCLWIYLMHRGQEDPKCCHGALRLR